MTIDEAIKHAEEVAEENEKSLRGWKECINRGTVGWSDFDKEKVDTSITRCSKCAAEHRQLAEWLKDYKRLKELEPCEDVIRREDAINAVSEALEHVVIEHEDVAKKMINKLPPVKPQELCEDTISRILKIMWNCRGKNTTSIDKVKMEQIIRDELQPKQESCEDAIRREDALQALCKAVHKNDDTIPCSNQRESCLWSKTKVQDYVREIWKLPSVTPQPKTGHWIRCLIRNEKGGCIGAKMICSKCVNDNKHDEYMNYCPNCGCRMVESQESEG